MLKRKLPLSDKNKIKTEKQILTFLLILTKAKGKNLMQNLATHKVYTLPHNCSQHQRKKIQYKLNIYPKKYKLKPSKYSN